MRYHECATVTLGVAAMFACATTRTPEATPELQPAHATAAEDADPRTKAGQQRTDKSRLGDVDFHVSCDGAAREEMNQALALLHHMMYLQAAKISISTGAISAMEKRARLGARRSPRGGPAGGAIRGRQAHRGHQLAALGQAGLTVGIGHDGGSTVYKISDDGCRDTIRPLFGPARGTLISDRATVFSFWTMTLRQVCHAHLLRKFVGFSERDGPDGVVGNELLECMTLIFEYWHGYKDGQLTREDLQFFMRPLQRDFEQLLERGNKCGSNGISGACADILEHREALWTFVTHEGVEPTNNHAELELRDFVLWRKRSFGTRSERGDRFAERIMTVVRTARKQGLDLLDFLVRSIKAQPSPPPSLRS